MKKSAKALLYAAAAFMLSGCIVDQYKIGPDGSGNGDLEGNVMVTLNLKTPGGFAPAATRALTWDQEVNIEDVRVLVFEDKNDGKLLTIKGVEGIEQPTGPGEGEDFDNYVTHNKGELVMSLSAADYARKLVVLTNLDGIDDHDMVVGDDNEYDNGVDKILLDLYEDSRKESGSPVTIETVFEALKEIGVLNYLWKNEDVKTDTIALPMWGEATVPAIDEESDPEDKKVTVHLMRAVARIDVGVGRPSGSGVDEHGDPVGTNHGEWTWNGKTGIGVSDPKIPFELKSVHVIRSSDVWAVIPDPDNVKNNKVDAPTVPTGTTPASIATAIANRLIYDGNYTYTYTDGGGVEHEVPLVTPSTANTGSYITRTIYIPEAEVTDWDEGIGSDDYTNRPALVVGGWYDASKNGIYEDSEKVLTYYRIDFKYDDTDLEKGDLFDILRNHLYQFNISGVSGPGKPDEEEAYRSESLNMTVNVIDWDDSTMSDIVWIGQKFFSFSERPVRFGPVAETGREIILRTNVDIASEGFTMTLSEGTNPVKIVAPKATTNPAVEESVDEADKVDFDYSLKLDKIDAYGVYEYILTIDSYDNFPKPLPLDDHIRRDLWEIVVGNDRITIDFLVTQTASETYPGPYTITINQTPGGNAQSSHETADAGERVMLGATPGPGKMFLGWEITRIVETADGDDPGDEPDEVEVPVTFSPAIALSANPLTFPMPAHDVTVTPVWGDKLPELPVGSTLDRGFILYFDGQGDNARLLLSEWDLNDTNNADNDGLVLDKGNYNPLMANFKFGSVVGLSNDGFENGGPFDDDEINIWFDPSTLNRDEDDTNDITNYLNGGLNSLTGADFTAANSPPAVPGFRPDEHFNYDNRPIVVSEPSYHNFGNLKIGLGDPCMLVGLTARQISDALEAGEDAFNALIAHRDTNPQYKGWRLPTHDDNLAFMRTSFQTGQSSQYHVHIRNEGNAANPGVVRITLDNDNPDDDVYLPATGTYRDKPPYSIRYQGTWGEYLSSTTDDWATNKTLYFFTGPEWQGGEFNENLVYFVQPTPVRCVRPEPPAGPKVSPTRLTFLENENYPGRGQNVAVSATGEWTVTVSAGFNVGPLETMPNKTYITEYTGNTAYTGNGNTGFRVWPAAANKNTTDIEGTATITGGAKVTLIQRPRIGGLNEILYFTGTENDVVGEPSTYEDNKLALGRWGTEINNLDQIALFKFGGVIGFSMNPENDGIAWDNKYVEFNPTGVEVTAYGNNATVSLPNIPGYRSASGLTGWNPDANDGEKGPFNSKLTTSPEYHNVTNLRAGMGDPCQLVGLTAKQISDAIDNNEMPTYSGWRTPTGAEGYKFIGIDDVEPVNGFEVAYDGEYSTYTEGGAPRYTNPNRVQFRNNGLTLPIVGNRDGFYPYGGMQYLGIIGAYWLSMPTNFTNGATMNFRQNRTLNFNNTFQMWGADSFYNGNPIRCVKDEGFRAGEDGEKTDGGFTGEPGDWKDKDLENKL